MSGGIKTEALYMRSIHNVKKTEPKKKKSAYKENIKDIYTRMVTQESQKAHPFGLAEKRFRWSKVSNGNDIKTFAHKNINKHKDNLEGGIGRFLSQTDHSTFSSIYAKKKQYEQNSNFHKTGRVINPELDTERNKYITHKKRSMSTESTRHCTDGSFQSLMKRTPSSFKVRGKKRNGSLDKEHNIFSKEFLNEKCTGLFGVMRRKRNASFDRNNNIFTNKSTDQIVSSGKKMYPLSTQATVDHLRDFH